MDIFTVEATAGQSLVLQLESQTADFNPRFDLFDTEGYMIAERRTSTSLLINDTGNYTVIVNGNEQGSRVGNYTLTLGDYNLELTAPSGGEIFFADSVLNLQWEHSIQDRPNLAFDLILLRDGGSISPIIIAEDLQNTNTFSWSIPSDLGGTDFRVQLVVKDETGPLCSSTSSRHFSIFQALEKQQVQYKYDSSNRLEQVILPSGQVIQYEYDQANNLISRRLVEN